MEKEIIYIACPYSGTSAQRALRFEQTEEYVAELIKEGNCAVSPIVHCHGMSIKYNMPSDYEFWKEYCITLLKGCSVMYVYMLDGWQDSVGVTDEIRTAWLHGIPISYIKPIT